VGPEALAEVVLDAEAGLAGRQAPSDADGEADRADTDQPQPVPDQHMAVAAKQGAVDGELRDTRDQQTQAHLREGEGEAGDGEPLVVAEKLGDAPERPHPRESLPVCKPCPAQ